MFDLRAEMGLEQGMSWSFRAVILGTIAVVSFGAGLFYSMHARAEEADTRQEQITMTNSAPKRKTQEKKNPKLGQQPEMRTIAPGKQAVDFEGLAITGELRNPGEFYFQRKTEEKFDSLVKRRKNFHREMLRDVVMAK